jgi:hypothetical protein
MLYNDLSRLCVVTQQGFSLAGFQEQGVHCMIELNFPNAVLDDKDFYGRQFELSKIVQTFQTNEHIPVVILGERRIGKTSLQNIVLKRLHSAWGRSVLTLQIEPRGITSFEKFAAAILQQLNFSLASKNDRVPPEITVSGFPVQSVEEFEAAFYQQIGSTQDFSFLLCIDEFDEIIRKMSGMEWARVNGLIHYLVERSSLPLRLFFTMTHLPEQLKIESSSTLLSKSLPVELNPFTYTEFHSMIEDIYMDFLEWSEDILLSLYQLSGGHPYFTKLILAHLDYSINCRQSVSQEMLKLAVRKSLTDPRANHALENLYRVQFTETEKEIVLLLAKRAAPLERNELIQAGRSWDTVARRLISRNYLREEQDHYEYRIAFVGDWLRNWIEFDEELERLTDLQDRLAEPVELIVDEAAGEVRILGKVVSLSSQEKLILACLAERSGHVVDRDHLINSVWNTDQGVDDQAIDTAIYRLRRKIGEKYIETIKGQGFRLRQAAFLSTKPGQ